jgi:hypothetical protein
MASYVPELGGYMVDVPKVHFTNCDSTSDRVWFFDELTAASFSPSQENIEINAGWSKYPIALIQSGAALEASFTSAKFSMALFEMAHNEATSTVADIARPKTIRVDVTSDAGTFTDAKADVTKVYVNGLELVGPAVTPLTKGKFHATLNGGTGVVTLDFFADDVTDGTTIDLTYYTAAESGTQLTIPTEGASARGELTFTYPVYSSGIDCEDASLLGELIIVIYKARVTTAPGFDSSYKSASTNQVTVTAMDPRRQDGAMYDMFFIEAA